jgi:hypothetical protein
MFHRRKPQATIQKLDRLYRSLRHRNQSRTLLAADPKAALAPRSGVRGVMLCTTLRGVFFMHQRPTDVIVSPDFATTAAIELAAGSAPAPRNPGRRRARQ